ALPRTHDRDRRVLQYERLRRRHACFRIHPGAARPRPPHRRGLPRQARRRAPAESRRGDRDGCRPHPDAAARRLRACSGSSCRPRVTTPSGNASRDSLEAPHPQISRSARVSGNEGKANIGVVGLAVMGSNLARNLASREGNTVAILNRSYEKTETLLAEHPEAGFLPARDYAEFAATLSKPRTAIIMVKAGAGTDAVIDELVKVFEPGDIIVDGGNALFTDTIRREKAVRETGIKDRKSTRLNSSHVKTSYAVF